MSIVVLIGIVGTVYLCIGFGMAGSLMVIVLPHRNGLVCCVVAVLWPLGALMAVGGLIAHGMYFTVNGCWPSKRRHDN